MSFRCFLLAGALLCSLRAVAQQPVKRPMTFADLMAMKRVSDPQVSPSGKWVLFSVTDVSLEKNTKVNHLWVVPLNPSEQSSGGTPPDGKARERQVTSNTGESNGRFSPDGKFVMYTGAPTKDDPYSRITIATWDDANGTVGMGRTLKAVSGDADGAIWSPDSKHFLFTTQVYPECSDKRDWAEEDACDKAKDDAAAASPVKAQIFDHLLYRHWNDWTGKRRTHILEADFSTDGANPRDLTPRSAVGDAETPTFSLGGPLGYAWAPDSHEIAYVTNLEVGFAKPGVGLQPGESTNNDVFTLRLDEPGAKAVKVSTSPGSDDGPQYSPDGKWLAWRSQARNGYESDKVDLLVMEREHHSIRNLTAKFDGWVDEFLWSPKSDAFYFASASRGTEPVFVLQLGQDGSAELAAMKYATEPGGISHGFNAEFGSLIVSGDGNSLVTAGMRADSPTALYRLRLNDFDLKVQPTDNALQQWARQNGNAASPAHSVYNLHADLIVDVNRSLLEEIDLTKQEPFWFAGADATKVQGFLVKPPNFDEHKKYPVKVLIHGGPQGAWGDAWSYRWNPELFAADGYVVVMVNPRGSTGYGQKFLEEVSGDWGGRPFEDLMRGLDYAEQHFAFIDKNRECALGASYGGYMANWVLTHTDRFKCIVTHDGMYKPQSAFGTTEELWFNEWEFRPLAGKSADAVVEQGKRAYPWDFYNVPASEDPFRKYSPMLAIRNAHTPTLVVHSQRDYRLDVSEGFQLFTALQLLGVPSKMLYFPDEGHWVLKPQNSQLWYATVNDWCDRWLGVGKYASQGPEKNPAAHANSLPVRKGGHGEK